MVRWWSSRPVLPESAVTACGCSWPPALTDPDKSKDLSPPVRGEERSFGCIEGRGAGLGKYLGHDFPAVQDLLQGVEVRIIGTEVVFQRDENDRYVVERIREVKPENSPAANSASIL